MRVKPGSTHDLFEEWGESGAILGVQLINNDDGSVAVARTTGFVEVDSAGGYRLKDFGPFPDDAGDYTLIFDDADGDLSPDHVSTRAVVVTSSAPDGDFDGTTFVTVEELYPILKIREPSEAQADKAERVVLAAAGEIFRELDLADNQELDGYAVALCAEVNLARAAELWREEEVQFGLMLSDVSGATYIAKDTWAKHAIKLSTLKGQWGFA